MNLFSSLTLTFAMYSKIPMPRVEWDEKSMQWVFPCFPLVGVVIGGQLWCWLWLAEKMMVSPILTGIIAALLPIAITGGIHLDGLCDTSDALGSNLPRERKLEIMKDPHIGAFGVMGCVVYLLMLAGCWCSVGFTSENRMMLAMIPVLSRCWVSLAAVTCKNAKKSGLLATFTDATAGKICVVIAVLWLAVSGSFFLLYNGFSRWMLLSTLMVTLYFTRMSAKEFGGITGDLAGWYLQMLELGMIVAVALLRGVVGCA